jgi:immune inhibitor A
MKRRWQVTLLVGITIFVCGCAIFSGIFGFGKFLDYAGERENNSGYEAAVPSTSPVPIRTLSDDATPQVLAEAHETLAYLSEIDLPASELRDLAERLEGKKDIPLTIEPSSQVYDVGDQQEFWVSNNDTNENRRISTTLQSISDHVYFWIEDGVFFDDEAVQSLVDAFENEIYPTNRQFFGSEWTPGVDADPHLYIIYARDLGWNLAGGFSSADEYHPLAHEYSNAHEAFIISADNVDLDSEFAFAVFAHEFQHMIHWNRDRNESTWVNEGFSELAVLLNGYQVGSEYSYIVNPDLQLNDWPDDSSQTSPHYGAAFLFLTYFLDRFGEEVTKEIIPEQANGLEGIDAVLKNNNIQDPLTGKEINADDVFTDWVIASYLRDEMVGDGRYTYHNFSEAPQAAATETIDDCPIEFFHRDVHQYGVDYIRINCRGSHTLRFEGSSLVDVVPIDAYSGEYFFWSNRGDEANTTITRSFDFTDHDGPLTLSYFTWYDLEADYDYIYLEISEDGETWQILDTPSGTSEDPSGNSYGWGYNGASNGWVQESVDLSAYSGKQVQIRFEYVTDAAVNGEGMVIDDIAIPEIGYYTDFEGGEDGWQANGWVRMNNAIPQTYRLSLITYGNNIEIIPVLIESDQSAEVDFEIGDGVEHVVLVISGNSRFSRQKAAYRIQIQ